MPVPLELVRRCSRCSYLIIGLLPADIDGCLACGRSRRHLRPLTPAEEVAYRLGGAAAVEGVPVR